MRRWVHTIWREANPFAPDGSGYGAHPPILQTAGPNEDKRFEALLHEVGEEILCYAWWMYCNANPRPYNLEPVKHVDEFTSKKGNRIVREVENQAAITRFPLSAFLAVADGYITTAELDVEDFKAAPVGSGDRATMAERISSALRHLKK